MTIAESLDGLVFQEKIDMMPNRSTDILLQLIHTLEKSEKRHFKLYIQRSSGKHDRINRRDDPYQIW